MTKDIQIYFDNHEKESRVFVTKDGTFFPEKNKQDAIRHQQDNLKQPVEAIKEVLNPAFEDASEEEATAGSFLNSELEEVKKELEEKEGLLTKAKDDLEATGKTLEAKQKELEAVVKSIATKGEELKAVDTTLAAKGKELKDLEAKLAKANKETK